MRACRTLEHLPRVPFEDAHIKLAGKDAQELKKQLHGQLSKIYFPFGIRAVQSSMLTVEDCLFLFTTKARQDAPGFELASSSR